MGFCIWVAICLMLAYYTNHFSNSDIYFFFTHYTLGWWDRFIACRCSNFSNILQFLIVCQWKFNIIIIFNTIALALQTSRVRSTNRYLILKPLVLDSTSKLNDNRHLLQNRCFPLSLGLPYFRHSLLHSSYPFHFFHSTYLFHPLHPSDPPHIVFSHSWDQGV